MTATTIDGKAFAAQLRETIKQQTAELVSQHGITPGLTVVLVGEDPASEVYVRNKGKQANEVGFISKEHKLPADTSQEDLLALVGELNTDPTVHGILVQFPVPEQISQQAVIEHIHPDKDVDGLHPISAGRLSAGVDGFVSCTPLGSMMLLKSQLGDMSGKNAVVVGRSNLVGKPMAQLLLAENCTVTVAHSRTKDLAAVCREADILIAAVGRPQMIRGDWVKPGATVIDVGINRIDKEGGGTRLVGDVDFESAVEVAGAITPVPGGVGPMTIGCLLYNTLQSAYRSAGLTMPDIG